MKKSEFKAIVVEALEAIPEKFKRKMENVEITVQDGPDEKMKIRGRTRDSSHVLGLYQGIPLPKRGIYYSAVLPDKIILYQRAIQSISGNREHIKRTVREVIVHEIGHHFGLSENELAN